MPVFPGCFQETNNLYFEKNPFLFLRKDYDGGVSTRGQSSIARLQCWLLHVLHSTHQDIEKGKKKSTLRGNQAHVQSPDHLLNHFILFSCYASLANSHHKLYRRWDCPTFVTAAAQWNNACLAETLQHAGTSLTSFFFPCSLYFFIMGVQSNSTRVSGAQWQARTQGLSLLLPFYFKNRALLLIYFLCLVSIRVSLFN